MDEDYVFFLFQIRFFVKILEDIHSFFRRISYLFFPGIRKVFLF